jgi:hypothetical protein
MKLLDDLTTVSFCRGALLQWSEDDTLSGHKENSLMTWTSLCTLPLPIPGCPVVTEPVWRDVVHQSRDSLLFFHWTLLHVLPPRGENRLHPSVTQTGRLRTWDPQHVRRYVVQTHALVDKTTQVLSNQQNVFLLYCCILQTAVESF